MLKKNAVIISSVCISGNGPTLVAINSKTNATFTYMWNSPVLSKTNTDKTKSIFIPRLIQFKNDYPKIFESSFKIISGPEYLIYELTENDVTILPENRFSQAYWNNDLLCTYKIDPKLLPHFVPVGHNAGCLKKTILFDLGIKTDSQIPVFCGGPDFITALIGTGTVESGRICDRAGSSEGINLCSDNNKIIFDKKNTNNIRILPSVIENLWNKSVIINDSGIRLGNILNTKYDFTSKQNDEQNSTLESLVKDLQNAYNFIFEQARFEKNHIENKKNKSCTVICSGGQTKNRHWMQYKACKLFTELSVTNCPDSELMGCAIIACTSIGIFSSIQQACKKMVIIEKKYIP
ncbi:MAG: hypothetical protein ACTTHG_06130 [Treponemataceae bacterium]